MRVVLRILFQKDGMVSHFIQHLNQTFLIVLQLFNDRLVSPYSSLNVIDWGDNKMKVLSECF